MGKEILSLGGGIQSFTLFLKNLHDEVKPRCDAAIFADTGWERDATYEAIDFLRSYAEPFGVPVHTVSNGSLREYSICNTRGLPVAIPFFVKGKHGNRGMLRRQCTSKFKIRPINRKLREMGATRKNPFTVQIGISVDEASRMRPSQVQYVVHRYPLVEERVNRAACYHWLETNGFYAPVRSACKGCPYRSDAEWRALTDSEFEDVKDFERQAQALGMSYRGEGYENAIPYLHGSLESITTRPFDNQSPDQLDFLKDEECEGGCFL